jgi:hypothetical protein
MRSTILFFSKIALWASGQHKKRLRHSFAELRIMMTSPKQRTYTKVPFSEIKKPKTHSRALSFYKRMDSNNDNSDKYNNIFVSSRVCQK